MDVVSNGKANDDDASKILVHIEVRLSESSNENAGLIKEQVSDFMKTVQLIKPGPLDVSEHEVRKFYI